MIDQRFIEDLKQRLTLSEVVGRKVKLARKGREHEGLCPFHNEKTPSFTVNDQKGFYHCFGCGEHGSAIDFVMKTEGLQFPEAVEALAGQAGVEVPKASPQAAKRAETRKSLSDVMQIVADWYAAQMKSQVGRRALEYVVRRGLKPETLGRYGIGYAPALRTALKDAMLARGIKEADLIEAGMLIKPEDGPRQDSYDRFRDRVMFPIWDRQGRVIAFGGRALDKDAKAKYLNSPETVLFHKGATLYNWPSAREAAYKSAQVIVVEGYMDVIALGEAGIDHAVAPLGTALTEEQMAHLWQMADEPLLMFDGDNAGLRAASRAVERALPHLKPGKSLRFVFIPKGQDPDDLVRAEGRSAIEKLVEGAKPLSGFLFDSLTAGVDSSTPERRAGLEKKIFSTLASIEDETVKTLYQRDFRSRLWDRFKPKRASAWQGKGRLGTGSRYAPQATGLLKATNLGRAGDAAPDASTYEKIMVLALAHHPEILLTREEEVAEFDFGSQSLAALRDWLVAQQSGTNPLDPDTIETHLNRGAHSETLAKLKQDLPRKSHWAAWPEAALADALTYFDHVMARYRFLAARADYERAEADFAADMTDENQARFLAAQAVYRELEEKEATIEGFGLESNRLPTV